MMVSEIKNNDDDNTVWWWLIWFFWDGEGFGENEEHWFCTGNRLLISLPSGFVTDNRKSYFISAVTLAHQLGHDWNDWSVLDQWKTFIQKEWFDWRFCFPTTSIPKFHIVKSGGVQSAGNDKSRWLGNDNNITAPPWRRGFLLRSEVFLICSCYHQQLRWFHEKGDNSS